MYLSVIDKKINKKCEEVVELNDNIIEDYNNLPFWKKLFVNKRDMKQEITNNWNKFGEWQIEEIREKRRNDMQNLDKLLKTG